MRQHFATVRNIVTRFSSKCSEINRRHEKGQIFNTVIKVIKYYSFGSWQGNYFKSIDTGDMLRLSRHKKSLQWANIRKT